MSTKTHSLSTNYTRPLTRFNTLHYSTSMFVRIFAYKFLIVKKQR